MKHDTVNDRKDKRMNALNVEEEEEEEEEETSFHLRNFFSFHKTRLRENALDFLKKNRETPPRAPLFF